MNTTAGAGLVDTATLNACTRAASSSVDAALAVVALLLEADVTGQTPNTATLLHLANHANEQAQRTYQQLYAAGGRAPGYDDAPRPDTDPLRALALANTPAARRLLQALRDATAAAEEVDAERGHVLPPDTPLLPGESRGTGWAETLSELALRLKIEVEGPADVRQGANE
jgi:hypothetical protein